MEFDYDVAIMGLGPAGAVLAAYLDESLRVVAIDKKRPEGDDGFQKPCGGLLAPDAQKALSRFGLTLPVELLVDPQIFSVRTLDLRTGKLRHYQRHYMNLDRHRFDKWLISLIGPHVDLNLDAACRDVTRLEEGYRLTLREGEDSRTVTARYIVGADGANSVVRRKLFPQYKCRSYTAIQQWFPDSHDAPFYSCVFDPEVTDCYAWGLTKDNHFIFGGAFPEKGAYRSFERLKEKLAAHGFRLDAPIKTEACRVLRPTGPGSFCTGRDGAFFVGEAAGLISPSSLEGISYAIQSGYLLSRCIGGEHPNGAYHRATRKIRWKLVGKVLKCPFMYQPFLRKMVMASGLESISMVEPVPKS